MIWGGKEVFIAVRASGFDSEPAMQTVVVKEVKAAWDR